MNTVKYETKNCLHHTVNRKLMIRAGEDKMHGHDETWSVEKNIFIQDFSIGMIWKHCRHHNSPIKWQKKRSSENITQQQAESTTKTSKIFKIKIFGHPDYTFMPWIK